MGHPNAYQCNSWCEGDAKDANFPSSWGKLWFPVFACIRAAGSNGHLKIPLTVAVYQFVCFYSQREITYAILCLRFFLCEQTHQARQRNPTAQRILLSWAIWAIPSIEELRKAHMCQFPQDSYSSGSRWARTKTKTFLECPGQNLLRTA